MCKIRLTINLCMATVMLMSPLTSWAQATAPEVMKEIDGLKQGQQRILNELQQVKSALKSLMQQRSTAQPALVVSVRDVEFSLGEDNPILGINTAKLAIIEFIDYQ